MDCGARRGRALFVCVVAAVSVASCKGAPDPENAVTVRVTVAKQFETAIITGLRVVLSAKGGFAKMARADVPFGAIWYSVEAKDTDGDDGREVVVTFSGSPFYKRTVDIAIAGDFGDVAVDSVRCEVPVLDSSPDAVTVKTDQSGSPIRLGHGVSQTVVCDVKCRPGVSCFGIAVPPTLTGTDPKSPANTASPRVVGSAPRTSRIGIYTNAECSGEAVGEGTGVDLSGSGIVVAAARNSTTTYYARAIDIEENVSECVGGISFTEESNGLAAKIAEDATTPLHATAPDPVSPAPVSPADDEHPRMPVVLSTDPAAQGDTLAPRVRGDADEGTTVRIYNDSACTKLVASGTAGEFASPGIKASACWNAPTTYWATASNGSGVASPCSSTSVTYQPGKLADSDGDGIPDEWENRGVDWNCDGVVDLDLQSLGANPDRKDIFVEVDYLVASGHTHLPSAVAIEYVRTAFANAPVANPDGDAGITLHVAVDEGVTEGSANNPLWAWSGMDAFKVKHLGTASERASPNWTNIRAAKQRIFRYAVFGHGYAVDGEGKTTSSGFAERPGNDFAVTLGAFANQVGTIDDQAGAFMHELGHTMNLQHGGGDPTNCKPNYLSVMSYSFMFPDLLPTRPLDYSRAKLPTLLESNLSEPSGISGPAGYKTVFGPTKWGPAFVADADKPIDWDQSGLASDTGVSRNINYIGIACGNEGTSGDEALTGFDDWSNLQFDVSEEVGGGSGRGRQVIAEITPEMQVAAKAISPMKPNVPPVAVAEASPRVVSGDVVRLSGSGYDREGVITRVQWAQVAGPRVALSDSTAANPTFIAPALGAETNASGTELVFEFAVRDPFSWSATASVVVTVVPTAKAATDVARSGVF